MAPSHKPRKQAEPKKKISLSSKLIPSKPPALVSNRITVAGRNLAPLIRRSPKNLHSKKSNAAQTTFSLAQNTWTWNDSNDLLMYRFGEAKSSSKVAAFDFDGCLVKTSLYRRQPDAWSVLFPENTQAVLQELSENGYKIVILSNQGGIGRAKKSKSEEITKVQTRIAGFIREMQGSSGLPIDAIVSANKQSSFHKPGVGMWTFLTENLNGKAKIDMKKSFYVGDAAGRRTDFADSDAKFAQKAGLRFFNETQFFGQNLYKNALS